MVFFRDNELPSLFVLFVVDPHTERLMIDVVDVILNVPDVRISRDVSGDLVLVLSQTISASDTPSVPITRARVGLKALQRCIAPRRGQGIARLSFDHLSDSHQLSVRLLSGTRAGAVVGVGVEECLRLLSLSPKVLREVEQLLGRFGAEVNVAGASQSDNSASAQLHFLGCVCELSGFGAELLGDLGGVSLIYGDDVDHFSVPFGG